VSDFDKRGKSIGREVDISNGALFLEITNLQREIQGLKLDLTELRRELEATKAQLKDMAPQVAQSFMHTMRIGGGG